MGVTVGKLVEQQLVEKMAPTKAAVKTAFIKADKDGNGKLSLNEFKVAMVELAEDDDDKAVAENNDAIEMLMSMVDGDGDKMVTCEELLKLLELGTDEDDGKQIVISMIKAADTDGNGYLTASELKELLLTMNPADKADIDKNIDMFMRMASTDGEKRIKIEEAIKLLTEEEDDDPQAKMKTMFRMCDGDGDGSISKKELAKFMNMCADDDDDDSPGDIKQMINMMMVMADEDGDGKVSYEEFCKMMDD